VIKGAGLITTMQAEVTTFYLLRGFDSLSWRQASLTGQLGSPLTVSGSTVYGETHHRWWPSWRRPNSSPTDTYAVMRITSAPHRRRRSNPEHAV
jgi:hypothetical protein